MSLIDDLKTFLMALAFGLVITVSINYVVVNYTDGPAPVQAVAALIDQNELNEYKAAPTSPVQKADTSASYGAYY